MPTLQFSMLLLLLLLSFALAVRQEPRNARVLTWSLPITKLGAKTLPVGLTVPTDSMAQIVLAFYTERSGAEAVSTLPPHSELTVHIPVKYNGGSYMHCLYGLVDDDIAMLLGRDASGIPLKLATFNVSWPADPTGGARLTGSIYRRGLELFRVAGNVVGAAPASATADLANLFNNQLNLFGTQAALPSFLWMKNPMNLGYLNVKQAGTLTKNSAWEVNLDTVAMELDNLYEPLKQIFGSSPPTGGTTAYLLEMTVGSSLDPEPVMLGPLRSNPIDFEYFLGSYFFKYGGQPLPEVLQVPASKVQVQEGKGDFEWQNGKFVWFTIKVNPETVAAQLPPGCTLADDEAKIFVVHYPIAHLNTAVSPRLANDNYPYHEFGVRLSIKYNNKTFQHVVYILVDDDVPLFLGRDLLGTPKKLARFDFPDKSAFATGEKVHFSISRRGVPILDFSGIVGANTSTPVPGLTDSAPDLSVFATQFPLYYKDGTDGKQGVGQPCYIRWNGSYAVHESRAIDFGQLNFTSPEPLSDWFVGQPLQAGFLLMDYGKAGDLHSRPVLGYLPQADGEKYWSDTYASKY